MERRLIAILAADVVGYSRLMARDEEATLVRLKNLRDLYFDPKIADFNGRAIKWMGDGTLVEFPSSVDAVNCAIAIQSALSEDENSLPIRIGINLGDVMVDENDIFGEGVNLAARLEAFASSGSVCISDQVFRSVQGKAEGEFNCRGEQKFKNIDRPELVWEWSRHRAIPRGARMDNRTNLSSIAVLPFDNMSDDPDQEYFSDGITEDIITELSRFKNLFVIARNSTFALKGQALDVREVGARLGISFLVEGSVRKAGNQVRVTAQLIEVETGSHLWAERYDRNLENIFEVQDEIVREIAASVPGQLQATSLQLARRRSVGNLSAYDLLLRGEWLVNQDFSSQEAISLFQQATEMDAGCARAYTSLATCYAYTVFAQGQALQEASEKARSLAEKALDIEPMDPAVQATAAATYLLVAEHDLARQHIEIAMKLNPNDYVVMNFYGVIMGYLGDRKTGLEWKNKVFRRDPLSGDSHREGFFDLYYMEKRYEEAIAQFNGWRSPPLHMHLECAAAYSQLNRESDANASMQKFAQGRPKDFDANQVVQAHIKMCAEDEDRETWAEGYRRMGFDV